MDLQDVYIAGEEPNSRWDICGEKGLFKSIKPRHSNQHSSSHPRFVIPSLCHPHIHLDKCFLLSHPKYAYLKVKTGDFAEALRVTNEAKSRFEQADLMERGRALIEESINFGVTHMRAFVEVDPLVQFKCLEAGLALKKEFQHRCHVQICVFAQEPIISSADDGKAMMVLLEKAASREGVEAIGSTPYVEDGAVPEKQIQNIEFTVKIARKYKLHLDFHLDYNLDHGQQAIVLDALDILHRVDWPSSELSPDCRTIVFGHCTRLTLFSSAEWMSLRSKVSGLPVSFVGLPTSDLFMMGRLPRGGAQRNRGTLQILEMIQEYGFDAAIGINNVGNSFTPQGSCDPLSVTSLCVGIYQAGTHQDTDLLLACVSSRAKSAIGLGTLGSNDVKLKVGESANFVVFGNGSSSDEQGTSFRLRKTVHEVVCDASIHRQTFYGGKCVGRSPER